MVCSSLLSRLVVFMSSDEDAHVELTMSIDCKTNYQYNYFVRDGARVYYGGIPKYVQMGDHQFVEDKVIRWWISLMLMGWYDLQVVLY